MVDTTRTLMIILIVAICTFITRLFPFVIFNNKKELPKTVKYLGDILPMAVIAILVVYCLKDINFTSTASFLPSIIAVTAVIFMHVWKRNNLISIGVGTLLYMILVQII